MKQNKEQGAGKEKNNPTVRRNLQIFFTLFINFVLISLIGLFVAALYSFALNECMDSGGAFPAPTQLLFDIFGYDSFALAFSYTPFIFLLYAAEQKEYCQQGKKTALLTVPNVWKSLVMYTLLILLSLLLPFLPFCGDIDGTEENARYFILAADAALAAGMFFRTRSRAKKNTPAG